MNSTLGDAQLNVTSGQSTSSVAVLSDRHTVHNASGGYRETATRLVASGRYALESQIEKCLRISPNSQKLLARQRSAEFVSPRRSFCNFLGLDYEPKKRRSHREEGDLNAEERERDKVSPALFAMKAKLAFIKACHSGDFRAVRTLVTRFGVSVKQECMALHFAADADYSDIVEYLLQHGADINSKDSKNRTALMYAAYKDNTKTVLKLLEANPDAEIQDDFGSTALMYAASGGAEECCKLLAEYGADLNMQNKDGISSLIYAIQSRKLATVKTLLQLGADPFVTNNLGTGALHWAAKKGSVECCSILLQYGVNVDAQNIKKVTPLMYAADCALKDEGNTRVMKFLIRSGADLSLADEDLSTALMYGAHSGSARNIHILLESGANAKVANKFGTTPIMYAAYYGHFQAFVTFLKHDPALRLASDKRKMTVRDWASQAKQEKITVLLDKMALFPLDWTPDVHQSFPKAIQEKVKALLLAAKSQENPFLHSMPSELVLKITSEVVKLEMWPMMTDA